MEKEGSCAARRRSLPRCCCAAAAIARRKEEAAASSARFENVYHVTMNRHSNNNSTAGDRFRCSLLQERRFSAAVRAFGGARQLGADGFLTEI